MNEHPLRHKYMTFGLDTSPFDAFKAFKQKYGKAPEAILYPADSDGQGRVDDGLAWSVENGIVLALHTDARSLVYVGPLPREQVDGN
jgi:hypothetical protein